MPRSFLAALWVVGMITVVISSAPTRADQSFATLKPDQVIGAFRVADVYNNELGVPMGARFRHVPSGFVLDVLRIQSVPQAFMWVNSHPTSDQGEPHTMEHLLLGKGTRGRYVASLEDMSLGNSSAFTMQLETCYHYHTAAGADVFFNLMQQKLDALLHPAFSDEEIRREVCNMGVTVDPRDSSLALEEKGTVYNEEVSSYERPWSPLGREMGTLLYGADHPLCLESGGLPDAIRSMTPADARAFHDAAYHLNNMGMIVAIPDEIGLDDCLTRTGAVLAAVEPDAKPGDDPAVARLRLPPPRPAVAAAIRMVDFPHQNPNEPGLLLYGWAPVRSLDNNTAYLLELLVANLAGGETSNLYRRFIDSQTRIMDLGASGVFGWTTLDLGNPVYVGFPNIKRESETAPLIDSVRGLILQEIRTIAGWPDNSPELLAFNERAKNRVTERRRELRRFLNSPPGFGFRGSGAQWMEHLYRLERVSGFRKSLALEDELHAAEQLLSTGRNFWKEYITAWQLRDPPPYAVAAVANPDLLAETESERRGRIDNYVNNLERQYGVSDRKEAIQRFRSDYDARTAVIDSEAAKIPMPKFIDNPPMTLDDQLHWKKESLPAGGTLVNSTFENMTGATAGLAFRMDVVPESLLLYTAALPALLTEVGVIKDGEPIAYDEMKEAIRKEILEATAYYSANYRSERVELVLRAAGGDPSESQRALDWLGWILFSPDWRKENLPRLRDAIDLSLSNLRNTMRYSEEAWVDDPANAYWKQSDPLILHTNSFLTQVHDLHRLRWLLKDAGTPAVQDEFAGFLASVATFGQSATREELIALASALTGEQSATLPGSATPVVAAVPRLSRAARALVIDAAKDLRQCLAEIPDATLAGDWQYLCRQMTTDLAVPPQTALAAIAQVMDLVRHADNVRGFMVGGTPTLGAMRMRIDGLVARLDKSPSQRQIYARAPRIVQRLADHTPGLGRPIFVGLVNENTRSGVFINTAPCASFTDHDREKLLNFLSERLYGGGGAHSMFMKTWSAGLAYSNGLRANEAAGRMIYYAERCPDLAQTMQFVVDQLKHAPYDTSLAQYAIAQAFAAYRSGSGYEDRGEAMAADLADGVTPEVVRDFRQGVLALRDSRDLYDDLHSRMEYVYGQILPGYGPPASSVPDALYFIIGPEKQFQSYEDYLHAVEGDVKLYRLYPRDYWIVAGAP